MEKLKYTKETEDNAEEEIFSEGFSDENENELPEVPLENSDEENENTLSEEASLDGSLDETDKLRKSAAKEKPKKKTVFKLYIPENLNEVFNNIAVKRARKLSYRPKEILLSCSAEIIGIDGKNEDGVKISDVMSALIKEGVKLGYLEKFDGLSVGELKKEYEDDVVYEYAEQEFKRAGLISDGKNVKVYIYGWDMKTCYHTGFIDEETSKKLIPYLNDKEKYSFDINAEITGGKYKKFVKDENGNIITEKGDCGELGIVIDAVVINRKD